ncbi:glycosyltransferase [Rubrivirga marina]|uniref:Uncharacterized protein n=1 Tax=Rubrivirga marina TaxID=1196024 RepID=A0A271IVI8_9BACT|nr:glycosyltransferase [Rubrivirga marina]PAP75271.1 hypothetical protein BSZ37_01835 [Rubrivirga marina]
MRVFVTTAGSRGDVQPYVALAAGLRDAGHDVTLSTAGRFEPLAEAHGVPFAPTTNALLHLMDEPAIRQGLETMTGLGPMLRQMPRLVRLSGAVQAELVDDSWEAIGDAAPDVIVSNQKAYWGPSFAAHLGARSIFAVLQPVYVPTGTAPLAGAPALPLGAAYNRLTYRAVALGLRASARRYLAGWRKRTGAGPPPRAAVPTVHGMSRHVVPEPPDWPDWAAMSGYWFVEEPSWAPPPDLQAFLDAGEPPVYVGFGSLAGRDPERATRLVVEALRAAGVRGLLATGWGGLAPTDLGDDLFMIEQAPHDALFPLCAAVVHHGGAGTTAAGLRAGRPTVICPFFGDQPFWGRRVHTLGAGPAPVKQTDLTPVTLAAMITEATTSASVRQRAEAFGEAIRAEDGVANAVAFIERFGSR